MTAETIETKNIFGIREIIQVIKSGAAINNNLLKKYEEEACIIN